MLASLDGCWNFILVLCTCLLILPTYEFCMLIWSFNSLNHFNSWGQFSWIIYFSVMGVELHEFGLMIMVINKYRNCFIICWCCEFMGMGKPQKLSHHKVYPTTGGFIKILVIRFLNNWAWIQFPVDWSSVWHNCLSGLGKLSSYHLLDSKKSRNPGAHILKP